MIRRVKCLINKIKATVIHNDQKSMLSHVLFALFRTYAFKKLLQQNSFSEPQKIEVNFSTKNGIQTSFLGQQELLCFDLKRFSENIITGLTLYQKVFVINFTCHYLKNNFSSSVDAKKFHIISCYLPIFLSSTWILSVNDDKFRFHQYYHSKLVQQSPKAMFTKQS